MSEQTGLSELQTAILREHVAPIARHYVKNFDVFAWLEDHPTVLARIESASTEKEIIDAIRPDLEPFLEGLSGSVFCKTCRKVHPAERCPIPELERDVVEAAVKLAQSSNHIDNRSEWEANEDALLDSAKALIEAREKSDS